MKVILISDAEAPTAAASVDVRVGSYEDPDDVPGMAHFLEHMLFLGTEKYPEPSEYTRYLNINGGRHNAFTSSTHTNYFFSIDYNKLEGALDRLSQFFIAPLFLQSLVERELNAINAEHSKNIREDSRRYFQTLKVLGRENHPFRKFSTGNKDTLANVPGLRERLLDFYESHYSANLMTVAIIGRESLKELRAYAEKYFSKVKNKNLPENNYEWNTLDPNRLPGILNVKTLRDTRTLSLNFTLPSYSEFYAKKPWILLGALIGNEAKGSLHEYLLNKNLITSLSAGMGTGKVNSHFSVNISLTKEGLKHTDEIIENFYIYLNKVKKEALEAWRYEEYKKLAQIRFKFLQRNSPLSSVIGLSSLDQNIAPKDILYAPYRYDGFDLKLLNQIIGYITPEKMLVSIQAQNVKTDAKEKWYGTEYSFSKPTQATLKRWENAFNGKTRNPALKLSPKNPFIPNDVSLTVKKDSSKFPEISHRNKGIKMWTYHSDIFKQAKSRLAINFKLPPVYFSPKNSAMTRLLIRAWKEALNPYTYPANEAGYFFNIDFSQTGIHISVNGFNEKLPYLLEQILDTTSRIKISPERFRTMKNDFQRGWVNMEKNSAGSRLFYEMSYLTDLSLWYKDEYIAVTPQITMNDMRKFHESFFSEMDIEMFLYGNLSDDLEQKVLNSLKKRFKFEPISKTQKFIERKIDFPNGIDLVRSIIVEDKDSALVLFFQGQKKNLKRALTANILNEVLQGPFYNQLRTQEQLGYIVQSNSYNMNYVPGLIFLIQSPEKNPIFLKQRAKTFLKAYEKELAKVPEKSIENIKTAMINQLNEPPKTSDEEFGFFWGAIQSEDFDFVSKNVRANLVKSITKKDLIEMYRSLILDSENAELAMMAWANGSEESTPAGTMIDDSYEFKRKQSFFGYYSFKDILEETSLPSKF